MSSSGRSGLLGRPGCVLASKHCCSLLYIAGPRLQSVEHPFLLIDDSILFGGKKCIEKSVSKMVKKCGLSRGHGAFGVGLGGRNASPRSPGLSSRP